MASRNMKRANAGERRYQADITKFIERLKTAGPWNLAVALPCPFLWDRFCDLNPAAMGLFYKVMEEDRCELSEGQCSIAVAMLLQEAGVHVRQA